jgi:hypothetical protein
MAHNVLRLLVLGSAIQKGKPEKIGYNVLRLLFLTSPIQ